MSDQNVDVVRPVYKAADRRDTATVLDLYDADVELDSTRLQLVGGAPGVIHGHEGLRLFFREWHEAWESIRYDYDDLIDAGGDKVVSLVTRRGRGRASGAEGELRAGLVWTLRAGKVVKVVWFPTHDEALESVGLQR